MKKKGYVLFNPLYCRVGIVLSAFLFLLCVTPFASASRVIYPFHTSCMSDSMSPAFNCKDTLYVEIVKPTDKLIEGDVYFYRPDYRVFQLPQLWWVVHRLDSCEGKMCIFKGDNNPDFDPPVHRKYINLHVVEVVKGE